jgi:DNA-binding response OmpR family regulator
LLVEDEKLLRDLGIANLENEGYRVLAAGDGIEAVALFEKHQDDIGLVVLRFLGFRALESRCVSENESEPTKRAGDCRKRLSRTVNSL